MRRSITALILLLALTAVCHAESFLDYFKGRQQATVPPAATDEIPIIQGNGLAVRRIKPGGLGFVDNARFGTLSSSTVRTTDPRLSDARTPLAHSQAANTITGLAGVATSGSYNDLSNKPNIPAAQVNSDWSAGSGVAQILNKPSFAAVATTGDYADLAGKPSLSVVATSGSYADLSNKPSIPSAATDISYSNPTYTTVAAALDELLYVPISITSYTMSGSASNVTQEVGSSYTLTGSGLVWSTNKAATTQTVNSVARTSPYMPSPSTVTTNTTYTLQVGDGQTTASSSRSVTFTWKRYWGVSGSASLTDGEIIALSNEFSTSRSQSRTMVPADQYMYVVYVSSAGAGTFTVNGFLDDSWQLTIRDVVNASGGFTQYRIYRSANKLTGTFAVVVS